MAAELALCSGWRCECEAVVQTFVLYLQLRATAGEAPSTGSTEDRASAVLPSSIYIFENCGTALSRAFCFNYQSPHWLEIAEHVGASNI